MMNKIRMAANVQPRTLKDAIDFQIGMVGLAQITGRDELFEASKKQLAELIERIPEDILL